MPMNSNFTHIPHHHELWDIGLTLIMSFTTTIVLTISNRFGAEKIMDISVMILLMQWPLCHQGSVSLKYRTSQHEFH